VARDGRYKVRLRRRREGKTDYRLRKSLVLSEKPRLVLRLSNKHFRAAVITSSPKGDIVHVSAHSRELENYGWNYNCGNIPAAYLTGLLLARKSAKAGFPDSESVLDIGLSKKAYGSRIFAALKGAVDCEFNINVGDERVSQKNERGIFPTEERINGTTIANFASIVKDSDDESYRTQFSGKNDPSKMTKVFEKTKEAIMKIK